MISTRPFIVIGMHRSGTSAIAGELSRYGVCMGKKLAKPQIGVNDKGFLENIKLIRFNDTLFEYFNSYWDDPILRNEKINTLFQDENICSNARKLIESEYKDFGKWGIKDPRQTILLPFWHYIFNSMNLSPHYIFIIRNPIEVSSSLKKRDNFSFNKGYILWLNYNFISYLTLIKTDRIIIDYSSLIENTDLIIKKIFNHFDEKITSCNDPETFIDKKLKRNTDNKNNDFPVDPFLHEIATNLFKAIIERKDYDVKYLYEEYIKYQSNLNPVLVEHINRISKSEIHFRNVFEEEYYSYTWKISRIIRKVESAFFSLINKHTG